MLEYTKLSQKYADVSILMQAIWIYYQNCYMKSQWNDINEILK